MSKIDPQTERIGKAITLLSNLSPDSLFLVVCQDYETGDFGFHGTLEHVPHLVAMLGRWYEAQLDQMDWGGEDEDE